MSTTAADQPGHTLIRIAELPPHEAMDAWEDQLAEDFRSRRTDAVLISSSKAFIGDSAYLDHGVEKSLDIATLAIASGIDGQWAENNNDERTTDFDVLFSETEQDLTL